MFRMLKKMILAGLMLSLGVAGFVACSSSERESSEDSVMSSAMLVTSSEDAQSVPDDVVGEYLSEVGDGEILKLHTDGSFVSYTMTDMCSDSCAITMIETVTGRYTETETGVCTLQIEAFEVKVEGMEDHPEEILAYVDLLAGADAKLRDMYTRLFEGETLTGAEFCGEDVFAQLQSAEIVAELDFENSTFSYRGEESADE